MLYNDKELFMQAVLEVSEDTRICVGIVEKDCWNTSSWMFRIQQQERDC